MIEKSEEVNLPTVMVLSALMSVIESVVLRNSASVGQILLMGQIESIDMHRRLVRLFCVDRQNLPVEETASLLAFESRALRQSILVRSNGE